MPLLILWLVVMVGAVYLLMWRPQQRRMQQVRKLQSELQLGDEILTTSGIYGRITKLGAPEDDVELEIAPGVTIRVVRGAIGQRLERNDRPTAGNARDGETGA